VQWLPAYFCNARVPKLQSFLGSSRIVKLGSNMFYYRIFMLLMRVARKILFPATAGRKFFGFTSTDVSKSTFFFRRQPEDNFWFLHPLMLAKAPFFPATAGRNFLVLHPLMLAKAPFFRRQPEENFCFYIP